MIANVPTRMHRTVTAAAAVLVFLALSVAAALLAGPAPSASAATTFYGADIAQAKWGDRTMIIASEYPDASGTYHRAFITTGLVVRRVEGSEHQRVDVRYVLERRTADISSRWSGWSEVQAITRSTSLTGNDAVDLLPYMFPERDRVSGPVTYRVVFDVVWHDAGTGAVIAGTLVEPTAAADASCLGISHIPCVATSQGTVWSSLPG